MGYHIQRHVSRKQQITAIDRLMNIVAIVHPLMTTPQVYQIYTSHDVTGISLLTWWSYAILGLVFLAYGIAHRLKPIIVTQILWFTMDTLVIVGIIIYR